MMKALSISPCAHDDTINYLEGREAPMWPPGEHYVLAHPMSPPYPEKMQSAIFGLGCFWGAEKQFWSLDGVYTTAVGYSAGKTPHPTYKEVCSGRTGHNEVVLVVYDPLEISYQRLLEIFWQAHNPGQGMRQGNDIGTQYRSGIYTYSDEQARVALKSLAVYQTVLKDSGYADITTEVCAASEFFFAEDYHQQYLAKNPHGYCGLGGLPVPYPKVSA